MKFTFSWGILEASGKELNQALRGFYNQRGNLRRKTSEKWLTSPLTSQKTNFTTFFIVKKVFWYKVHFLYRSIQLLNKLGNHETSNGSYRREEKSCEQGLLFTKHSFSVTAIFLNWNGKLNLKIELCMFSCVWMLKHACFFIDRT